MYYSTLPDVKGRKFTVVCPICQSIIVKPPKWFEKERSFELPHTFVSKCDYSDLFPLIMLKLPRMLASEKKLIKEIDGVIDISIQWISERVDKSFNVTGIQFLVTGTAIKFED